MTRQYSNKSPYKSREKDFDDRVEELNFSDEDATPSFKDLIPDSESDFEDDFEESTASARSNTIPENKPTDDDLTPEILIKEDGALSPREPGDGSPVDQTLTLVEVDDIGAGIGLDEAELAEIDPLDKKANAKK